MVPKLHKKLMEPPRLALSLGKALECGGGSQEGVRRVWRQMVETKFKNRVGRTVLVRTDVHGPYGPVPANPANELVLSTVWNHFEPSAKIG